MALRVTFSPKQVAVSAVMLESGNPLTTIEIDSLADEPPSVTSTEKTLLEVG